ncbi:GIY-YIG nuclease family protein [Silvibacterium dinghuense]|uniref:GIY-YIG nuclease family protein n=1 Tax=Silvibacterium dinghuense TaxID=1560006 RepID=A0A4Q1SI76_9BACT|nr:GIY-YIG nuclease family protein [Silvibacterium dinghuense]RXS97308.1 GIY-YIG nuclease family protein [Silvibacterium dinghuense]GGG97949.1 nuclease [Silvibacterium dinghuense]
MSRCYFVYLIASRTRVLYCGVTGNLEKRTYEHQNGIFEGFSSKYHCTRLVWFEAFEDVRNAIDRETQIKRWRREKKLALITRMNPSWTDLSESWQR